MAITPLPASGIAAFYHATARLVAWLGSLPQSHSSQWAQNQDLADNTTWTSSSLTSLKTVHSQLLADYGCTEWAPPAADDANDAAAAQQRVDDDANARPLPIPPLNLLASMQARQDADEGNAAARASLPPQRHITTRIMHQWPQHQQTAANPPSRRAQEVHQLHCPQSMPMLTDDSALRRDMPQRNDESEDALNKHRISFSPAGAVWGKMGQAWLSDSRKFRGGASHTQTLTQSDYVAFFCQFFGYTDNPTLAPIAQEPCRCQRYRHDSDHINCCHYHSGNWYRAHEHVLRALMGIFRAAGYSSSIKSLPTSDGHRRADLHVVGAHLMGKDDLMVDVTVRHDFIGDARDVLRHGTLRNPDRPDQPLNEAAADKIRSYREPYSRNRSLAFLPACMSTSGRIHSEFLRLLYFLADKQASDYFTALGYEPPKEEYCHRRGVYFYQHRCTIGLACAQAVAIRGAPHVARRHAAVPRALQLRVALNDWDRNDVHERVRA